MSGSTTNNNIIGSGSDTIVVDMSEDQAQGVDAAFTLNVDGQQIGGLQTVTASQSAGQTEQFTFEGNFAPGPHTVTVTYDNNFIYPGLSGDRNLYVDGVTYDGTTVSNTATGIYNSPLFPPNSTVGDIYGNAVYTVNDTTAVPAGAPSTPTTTPAAVSVGNGADNLVLNMAEDPYDGNAQFTVSVDGQQIGGTQTTTASVAQGQFQEFDVHGNFGAGTHQVTVTYLSDTIGPLYPGTDLAVDTTDQNLYVMGASLDGGPAASGTPWEQATDGSYSFSVTAGTNPDATAASSGLFATDGAPATSDNAAISAASLTSGSSSGSGMTFVASSSPDTGGGSSSDSGGSTVSSSVSQTTPTVQDVTTPTPTATSSGADTSGSSSGMSGHWFAHHDANSSGYYVHHQHG